jgi:hypothetical protein
MVPANNYPTTQLHTLLPRKPLTSHKQQGLQAQNTSPPSGGMVISCCLPQPTGARRTVPAAVGGHHLTGQPVYTVRLHSAYQTHSSCPMNHVDIHGGWYSRSRRTFHSQHRHTNTHCQLRPTAHAWPDNLQQTPR